MLILANADRRGIDFYRFGQGILDAAGDGDGAADGDVQVGQFFPSQFRCRVDRSAGFIGDDVAAAQVVILDELGDELFRFIRGRPIADGNEGDAVAADHIGQILGALFLLRLRMGQVIGPVVEDPTGGTDDSGLAARAKSGVEAQDDLSFKGRLQEEVAEIFGKDVDGLLFGLGRQFIADFPIHLRED